MCTWRETKVAKKFNVSPHVVSIAGKGVLRALSITTSAYNTTMRSHKCTTRAPLSSSLLPARGHTTVCLSRGGVLQTLVLPSASLQVLHSKCFSSSVTEPKRGAELATLHMQAHASNANSANSANSANTNQQVHFGANKCAACVAQLPEHTHSDNTPFGLC